MTMTTILRKMAPAAMAIILVAAIFAACGPGTAGKEPAAAATAPAAAPEPILAPVPPMGFNTWNKFGCEVDETLIRQNADVMVETGMLEAGSVSYTHLT